MDSAVRPLLVYDGECRFCTATALRLAARWPASASAAAVSWQSLGEEGLAAFGLSMGDVASAAWWIDERDRKWGGHLAVARALIAAGGWRRRLGQTIAVAPLRPVAAVIYGLVARYRRHLPVPRLPVAREARRPK